MKIQNLFLNLKNLLKFIKKYMKKYGGVSADHWQQQLIKLKRTLKKNIHNIDCDLIQLIQHGFSFKILCRTQELLDECYGSE